MKEVTVDGAATTGTLADGTYTFKVFEDSACSKEAKKADGTDIGVITLTIVNGKSDSKEVEGLVPGDYYVQEQDGSNKNVDLDKTAHKVTVVAGETGAAAYE